MLVRILLLSVAVCGLLADAVGADWSRFRGPGGSGVSPDSVPITWDESENVKWKKDLPGPGLSSPIIIGDHVIVTYWTGYANGTTQGSLEDLKRNVLCLSRDSGNVLWNQAQDAVLPEDTYTGMFVQNGYASHTPVSDGERVYVFYGKSGVLAYDLKNGRKLWEKNVGLNLERKGWGSASSPIFHDGTVIVPAFIEDEALLALDAQTGDVLWKQDVPGYTSNWSTPILVATGEFTDLVLAVPGEVWGLNPANGKLRWYCEIPGSEDARSSVTAQNDIVIAMSGRRGAGTSIAVRAGGRGDVQNTHKVWQGNYVSSVPTPVIYDDRIYLVHRGVVTMIDLDTGRRLKQLRLTGSGADSTAPVPNRRRQTRREPGEGRGYTGLGGADYSSPVVAGNKLYYVSRGGDTFVLEPGDDMKQIACNRLGDEGEYNSTPALSNGELFIRSTNAVYCVAESTTEP